MNWFFRSSIGKKLSMAVSAIFLMIFLLQHFLINVTSLFSPNLFNYLSHFMGTNLLVQFVAQPLLISGVIFHFIMGIILEFENRKASGYSYSQYTGSANSSWVSRNMIISGLVIIGFLILHFIDFWIPEISYKYIHFLPSSPDRYYAELTHKFTNPIRVIVYCISFLLLSLHLLHGFTSSIKSIGAKKSQVNSIKTISYIYSIGIPMGFCIIAIFHYFNH